MKSVGIDIGNFSIKVAEVDASGKSAGTVLAFHEHPINPDPKADRQLEIIEILRNISDQYDRSSTRFVVGIPQNEVSARLKLFPFKERPKILKSLAFELEDEIPLDLDETIFEAKICEYLGDGAQVLALATPVESVGATLTRFRDGGIDPEIVSVEGMALANCLERWYLPPPSLPDEPRTATPEGSSDDDSTAPRPSSDGRIVLHIGHCRTILLAYREGTLVAARSILWGGAEVADALARTFSVPYLEGVKILQTKSFLLMSSVGASRDQQVLSNCVAKEVENLVREVKLTVLDIKTEFNISFIALDLLGGASQIQNLGPYLTQSLEIPANTFHHFPNHRGVKLETSAATEAVSAVAIGLAIEGIKRPRNPAVNFRKGEFARQNKTLQEMWERWRPALMTAVAAYALFNVYSFTRDMMTDGLVEASSDAISTQAAAIGLGPKQRSRSAIKKYIRDTEKQVKARRTLAKLDGYVPALDIALALAKNIPIGSKFDREGTMAMDIKSLTIDNDSVKIEGRVSSQAQIGRVRTAIEKIAIPKSIKTGTPSSPKAGAVPFAFEFKVNRIP